MAFSSVQCGCVGVGDRGGGGGGSMTLCVCLCASVCAGVGLLGGGGRQRGQRGEGGRVVAGGETEGRAGRGLQSFPGRALSHGSFSS